MADWAHALTQGLAAGAATGAGLLDREMKIDQQIAAEQRAADLKLDTHSRMLAIEDAMKTRAAERFSSTVKTKMGEQVPMDAEPVSKTGITHDSGDAIDLPSGGLEQDPASLKRLVQLAQDTLINPTATDEQRADARALLDQIGKQSGAQDIINKDGAKGKTRARTVDEASQAALDDALQNDAPAFVAGTGMLNAANKSDLEQRKIDSRERIAAASNDRKERADNLRYETMIARIEAAAGGAGGKNGKSATVQNLEWLRENLKMSDAQLIDYVTEKKHTSAEDIAAKLLAADKFHDMTPEQAMEKAMALMKAREAFNASPDAKPGAAPKTLTYDPTTGKFK